jgi:hypothetical protein
MEYLVVLGIDEPGMGLGVVEELVVEVVQLQEVFVEFFLHFHSVGQELLEFVERRLH